jgi:hypothetical protein
LEENDHFVKHKLVGIDFPFIRKEKFASLYLYIRVSILGTGMHPSQLGIISPVSYFSFLDISKKKSSVF